MNYVAQLPFLPISMPALAETAFFVSLNATVVRAGFYMLEAAWRSTTPGSIPSSFSALASITRIPEAELDAHYDVLVSGWELQGDGRLHHLQMEEIVQSVQERFGAQIGTIADAAVLACQGGDVLFELAPVNEVAKKDKQIRGKRALPKDFAMDKATFERAVAEGYGKKEHMEWLLQSFQDFALSGDRRYVNWQATCRNFMSGVITRNSFRSKFHFFPGEAPSSSMGAFIDNATGHLTPAQRLRAASRPSMPGPSSFQERTANRNSDMMAEAIGRQFAPAHLSEGVAPGMAG